MPGQIVKEDDDGEEVLSHPSLGLVTQLAMLGQLTRMRKLEESKVPVGVKPVRVTVPDTITRVRLDRPWISFSMINDGANALTVWVNEEKNPSFEGMVLGGEPFDCDMRYPIIHTVYLKSQPGTTNVVRIYGKEGK